MEFRDLIPFGRERRGVPAQRDRHEHPLEAFQREVNRLFDDFFRTPALPGGAELTLANNVLTIRGEKKAEREEKDKDYYLSERSFGSFRRSIPCRPKWMRIR